MQKFQTLPFVQSALSGSLTKPGYTRFMKDYYHFVRTAGPIYSACASHIGYDFPRVREWFLKAAYKETDHDHFVVNDLETLGVPAAETRASQPGPEMDALCAYNFAFVERHHPVGMLGTPFLMGNLSTVYSLHAAQKIKDALGLKENGASFFEAHGHLDKAQPEDVGLVLQSITDPKIQNDIFLNAKTIFMLYQNFFRTLTP